MLIFLRGNLLFLSYILYPFTTCLNKYNIPNLFKHVNAVSLFFITKIIELFLYIFSYLLLSFPIIPIKFKINTIILFVLLKKVS